MSIRTWWMERCTEIERVRKVRYVTDLTQKLEAINQESNKGRLKHLVYHISTEIREMTCTSGGWTYSYVDITMSDHYTITASSLFLRDALKDVAKKIVKRLLDKRGIPSLEETKDV